MPAPSYRRGPVVAWALYDVANSSFTTLIVTFIYSAYFVAVMGGEAEGDLTSVWTTAVSITAVLVALLSPVLGAIADRGGYRKRFLLSFSAICVLATASLFFFEPGQWQAAIVVFVIANLAFELGGAFYDAFLPDLAPPEAIGRISGFGWGLGYVGGIFAMVIALFGFVQEGNGLYDFMLVTFRLSTEGGETIRATNLLVAVWFAVFTLPFIFVVREPRVMGKKPEGNVVMAAYRQLADTFKHLRSYRQIVRLLLARLIYNDGLVVIFAMGAIFAQNVYDFTTADVIIFGIAINVAAGIGAISFGFIDDRIGGRNTILISLVGLSIASLVAVLGTTRGTFWAAALLTGVLVGPTQAASRSLLGRFVPDDKESEFYGFFAFSGKATAFLGPTIYGALAAAYSHRAGMGSTLLFFVIGFLLLLRVDEAEGIRLAGRQDPAPLPPEH